MLVDRSAPDDALERLNPFDAVSLDALRRRRTVKWSLYGPDVLAAWVAEMDFDVAEPIRTALLEAIDRQELGYTPADVPELTAACSAFLADAYGWEISPRRIELVADVIEGIRGALELFVPPGSGVVVATPAYPPFFEIIGLTGRPVVETPLVEQGGRPTLDLDAIDDALRNGAGAVLLCNPHNPTGRVLETDELTALADVVERHGARVIADEVHAPLVYPGHRHLPYANLSPATAEHTITVTSASKGWNIPGVQCAQIIFSNRDDLEQWRRLLVRAVAGPIPLGIAASTAAYATGEPWRRELVAYLDANRQHLVDRLAEEIPELHMRLPEATYLAWLDCSALGVDDPAGFFLEHGKVAVNDGPPFGAGFDQHVRLNFGTSRALLDQIVEAMGTARRGAFSRRAR